MGIIRLLGGVTRAEHDELLAAHQDLDERVRRLALGPPPDPDVQAARNAAISAQQDANSAANNAAVAQLAASTAAGSAQTAAEAVDGLNEALADHATEIGALDRRVTVLEGGQPGPGPQPGPEPEPEPGGRAPWSLTVDPNAPDLPASVSAYLGHLLDKTDNSGSGGAKGIRGYAQQGNLYQLARPVRDCVQALLMGLRATGHPRFLDAIDTIMEDMRSALRPGWRGVEAVPDGAPGGNGWVEPGQHPDGIWVWQTSGQSIYTGRDNHPLDSVKTFALVASAAFAYHQNGLTAKRDYWLDHLARWEAAWRSNRWQRRRPTTGPIFNRGDGHTHHAELVLYATMHAITGERRWRDYADVLHRRYWVESSRYRPTTTPTGPALVWYRGRPEDGTAHSFSAPLTYARYYFSDALELHYLNFGEYANEENMRRLARTITQLVLLPGLPTSAGQSVTSRDVSGGIERASIPASPSDEWSGLTTNLVTGWSCLPLCERWDDTGRLRTWNDAATQAMGYQTSPKGYALPIARLVAATP